MDYRFQLLTFLCWVFDEKFRSWIGFGGGFGAVGP